MSENKPPRSPLTPPPLPPRLDSVRPGIDRPEDRPRTAGRPAMRQPVRPPYDPSRPPVGSQSRSAPSPRRRGWLAASAIGILGLLALAGAGATYLAVTPPVDFLRQQVIAAVKAKTGRDLTIAGPVSLALFPELTLSLHGVALSAPPGMQSGPLVTMEALDAGVRLLPLLQSQISVDHLVLHRPVFDLRADKSGKRSWDFAELETPRLVQVAQATPPKAAAGDLPDAVKDFVDNASDPTNPSPQMKARLARLEELTLGDIHIDGGTVRYGDDRTGAAREVTGVDAHLGLKSLASPLDASGALVYENRPVTFGVKLASLRAILEDRPAKLTASIKSAPVEAQYDGTMTMRAAVELEGDLTAKAPSLRALALWFGHEMPPADGFGAVALAGKLKAGETSYVLNDANLAFDGETATGTALLDLAGPRPRINANLKISALDLNRYTLAAGKTVTSRPKTTVVKPAAGPAQPAAKSIEDLINATSGAQVKGYTKRTGWSEERIPLEALGLADADAKLTIGQLRYRSIVAGVSTVNGALKSKVLRLNFDDVALYDGHGRGFIQLDANPAAAVAGVNLALDGVAAQGLLKDAADFELLAGKAKVSVAIGAQGASEAELVRTSNGKADISVNDGAVVGYNLTNILRGLSQGRITGLNKSPSEKTDFSELAASFTIQNGIATNQDMRLTSPLLRVTGAGQIAVPAETVDYTVKPKLVASADGQGASGSLDGLEVPVRINGPWAAPAVAPDLGGVLKDPGKTVEAVKGIAKQLKDSGAAKQIGDAAKGIDTTKAKDFLNKLFNKQ